MNDNNLDDIIHRSLELRKKYRELELQHHGSEWTVEEDALAYLTDAGLVGRQVMSQQQRWPLPNLGLAKHEPGLSHKLGENIWWLIVLANRMDIDIKTALNDFLSSTEKLLDT